MYLRSLKGIQPKENHTSDASSLVSIRFRLASRKCETFSYTRKVTMQAGTTRVKLAFSPL